MAQYEHLPIYKKALDLAIYIEEVVKGFARYHKYTLGSELRAQSRAMVGLVIKANSQQDKAPTHCELRDLTEQFKVTLRICKEVKAFRNFNSFTTALEEALSLSRQNEGWLRSMQKARTPSP